MRENRKSLLFKAVILLIICAATGSLWYATTPWRFFVEKKSQLAHDVSTFMTDTENTRRRSASILQGIKSYDNIDQTVIPYAELRAAMEQYNEELYNNHQVDLSSTASYSEEGAGFDLVEYGLSSNIFGVLKIPKTDLEMPLYLGASYPNLANGAATLSQTSIPIGGENTNAVIAGHRGWKGYSYFKDIEKLEPGDRVLIINPWETLTYKVIESRIINPSDIESVLIRPGEDMITLLTCHPPNSGGPYRFLVFCERDKEDDLNEVLENE